MSDERPCVDCGEPTLNDLRCRDCDIDYLIDLQRCELCGDGPYFVARPSSPLGVVYAPHKGNAACSVMAL